MFPTICSLTSVKGQYWWQTFGYIVSVQQCSTPSSSKHDVKHPVFSNNCPSRSSMSKDGSGWIWPTCRRRCCAKGLTHKTSIDETGNNSCTVNPCANVCQCESVIGIARNSTISWQQHVLQKNTWHVYLFNGLDFSNFPYIGEVIPIDFDIVRRGRHTTNQLYQTICQLTEVL